MASNSDNVFMQIMWTCILWQSVSLFPVIDKAQMSENSANVKDPLTTNMKYLRGRAISNKDSSLALAKLGSRQSRTFLQQDFSDILKRRQNSLNKTEGYFRVLNGNNLKTPLESNRVFSQRRANVVNLHLSQKLEERGRTVKGKGRSSALGSETSAVPQTLGRNAPLHPTPLDFHQSFNNPVVNHLSTSPPSLGELKQAERKSQAVFTYESNAGGRTDGIQKAEALTANLQATPQRRVSTMILIISSTFVVLLVTCVTVSIFQCCCRKKSSNEDLQQPEGDKNELENNVPIIRSRSSIHDTPTYRPLSINSTGDGLEEVLPSHLSVRDKIRAFETVPAEQHTTTPEPGKPARKRPKSKAFEEFENQGIIIGMGKVRSNRPKSSMDPDYDNSNESGLFNEIMASMSPEYNNITMLSDNSDKPMLNGSHMHPDTEISPNYIDDEDEFGEIQRNTHILRSFKRAPPPKNRSRSKRSSRKRLPLKDSTNTSISESTETHSEIPDSFLRYEEKPTDTSVQKGWHELGSPSIHSSESRTDLQDILTGTSTNGRTHPANSHTSHIVNGYSHTKEELPRKRSDREATPPDKSLTNGNYKSSCPPKGMTTYENPCYESLDIIQANINRVTDTRKSPDKTESPPTRLPRARDRQTTPPNKDSHSSPTRREDRSKRQKSSSRISPDSHRSPERNEKESQSRKSPPKNGRYDTRANSEKRKSWKEIPPSDSDPKPLKQTHL